MPTELRKCYADIERTRSLTTANQKLLHAFQQGICGQQGNIVALALALGLVRF